MELTCVFKHSERVEIAAVRKEKMNKREMFKS